MSTSGYARRYAVEVEDAIAVSTWGFTAQTAGSRCALAAAKSVFLFDFRSGQLERKFELPHADKAHVAVFGSVVAAVTEGAYIRVSRGDKLLDLLLPSSKGVESICLVSANCLAVLEREGGIGTVTIGKDSLQFEALHKGRAAEGATNRLYSTLFSAADKSTRSGHVVTSFPIDKSHFALVCANGTTQAWQLSGVRRSRKPLWNWNIATAAWELVKPPDASQDVIFDVVGACQIGSEDRLCAIIAFSADGHAAKLYVVTCSLRPAGSSKVPTIDMVVEVGTWGRVGEATGSLRSVHLAVSSGVAYIVFGEEHRAAYVSLSPGISTRDQIYGEVGFFEARGDEVSSCVSAGDDEKQGGSIGILYRERFVVVSAGVPAPTVVPVRSSVRTRQRGGSTSTTTTTATARTDKSQPGKQSGVQKQEDEELDTDEIIWRSYLQYASEQIGAARVTLKAIAADFDARGGAASAQISRSVSTASTRIINGTDVETQQGAPTSMLINQSLADKQSRHAPLLVMLGDARVLSMTLWEIMDQSARSLVVGNSGRLAAAIMVRQVENSHSGDSMLGGTSAILREALHRGGEGSELYEHISRFEKFLPALQQVFEDVVESALEATDDQEEQTDISSAGEAAIIALGGCLGALNGGLEARYEILEKINLQLEDRGGWPCNERSVSAARTIINRSLIIAEGCPGMLRKTLTSVCADLTDVLLAALREREGPTSSSFRTARSAALLKLKPFESDRCLDLAEKYGDFELMLELTCDRADFADRLEAWARSNSEDFLDFAFQWLDEHGKVTALLEPRTGDLGSAQERFFSQGGHANLQWIQRLGGEDFAGAAEVASEQGSRLASNGGENGLEQTKTLFSVVKLAALATRAQPTLEPEKMESGVVQLGTEADRRLYLVRAQEDIAPSVRAVLPADEVVRRYVDRPETGNEDVAIGTVVALEVLRNAEMDAEQEQNLRDYTWRHCVLKQLDRWRPIVEEARRGAISDERLSSMIKDTGFFLAAVDTQLTPDSLAGMFERGVFAPEGGAYDQKVVHRLIRTAVDLAVASESRVLMNTTGEQGPSAESVPMVTT